MYSIWEAEMYSKCCPLLVEEPAKIGQRKLVAIFSHFIHRIKEDT